MVVRGKPQKDDIPIWSENKWVLVNRSAIEGSNGIQSNPSNGHPVRNIYVSQDGKLKVEYEVP